MENYDVKAAKKIFSKVALALIVILLLSNVFQILWILIPGMIWGREHWLLSSSWGMWLSTFVPVYLLGVPLGLLMFRLVPSQEPPKYKLRARWFIVTLLIGFCLMYVGNIVGTLLSLILSGGTAENAVATYAMDTNPLKILVVVILAPMIEEYIFRKKIIDCIRQYGEKTAVIFSGLAFGLFHLNFFQFFYACALGMVFAYVYVRTGRLRYSVFMHAIVNFMGAVVAPFVMSLVDLEALDQLMITGPGVSGQTWQTLLGLLLYLGYAFLQIGLAITGLVLLILFWKRKVWLEAPLELPKGQRFKTVYLNWGMILYIIICFALIIYALF